MLSETRGCTRGANPPAETSPGCRAFITQSEEEVCNDEPRNCVANARWQGVVNFVLGAWIDVTVGSWLQRGRSYRDECLVVRHHHCRARTDRHLRLRELTGVGCRSHRRLGVYLPMGARRGVRRAHPVELADRRGAARDPGGLVVLARARFGSRHVATLTHSRVAATLRRVCRRASAWP